MTVKECMWSKHLSHLSVTHTEDDLDGTCVYTVETHRKLDPNPLTVHTIYDG